MSTTSCYPYYFPAQFLSTPYEITAGSINIQNVATGKSFIGIYTQNQFTVPINGGLSTSVTLNVIDPTTNQVVDTLNDQITFTLGQINQCQTFNYTTFETTFSYNAKLSGYSQYFGSISTKVNVNSSFQFTKFENTDNISFQTTLNGEAYSIAANGVFIQKA